MEEARMTIRPREGHAEGSYERSTVGDDATPLFSSAPHEEHPSPPNKL